MDGLLIVIDKLGRWCSQLEQENEGLRLQVEALGQQLAEHLAANSPAPPETTV